MEEDRTVEFVNTRNIAIPTNKRIDGSQLLLLLMMLMGILAFSLYERKKHKII